MIDAKVPENYKYICNELNKSFQEWKTPYLCLEVVEQSMDLKDLQGNAAAQVFFYAYWSFS